ncbi:hypothetical protein [Cohnella faecalis]|uniref:hypothetical protein n=1 Tax=Cohnella faecalis TaxID=2315694 RepID=UPI001F215253|nr:hypothetical protein [Cohnella faecalis]
MSKPPFLEAELMRKLERLTIASKGRVRGRCKEKEDPACLEAPWSSRTSGRMRRVTIFAESIGTSMAGRGRRSYGNIGTNRN